MPPVTRNALAIPVALLALAVPAVDVPDPATPALPTRAAADVTTKVLVITVDSLSSRAVRKLGPQRAPNLHRLLEEGAGTLNARTVHAQTMTLPNHTSIVTGRRIDASHGGHGVDWNDERTTPRTVQEAAGHEVVSVFSAVDSDERDPGLFVSKDKLGLFKRSWRKGIDRFVVREDNRRLVRLARADLVQHARAFTFLHLSWPDDVGHEHGFLSGEHLDAVADTDRRIGKLLAAIDARPRLRNHLTLILTSDHGGRGKGHYDPTKLVNYRVPFLVWGVGVAPGADLYELNDDYRNPRRRRTTYAAKRPPVRNADAANLALDLLGLAPVEGSEFDVEQDLDVDYERVPSDRDGQG